MGSEWGKISGEWLVGERVDHKDLEVHKESIEIVLSK